MTHAQLDGAEKRRQAVAMTQPLEHRINLRMNAEAFTVIDRLRCEGAGKMSRNAWLAQAVVEKMARDLARQTEPLHPEGGAGHPYYEFFAGGGMARAGLGEGWSCAFANDFDPMKARVYRQNWNGGHELLVEDINKLIPSNLPGQADLAWASFPCQDLSLAGNYEGIGQCGDTEQTRSGTFWPFWKLMRGLMDEGRGPKIIVLENVLGVMTSNGGRDFAAIGSSFSAAGYRFGAMVIDARRFVPQSRPRVFIVGVRTGLDIPAPLIASQATPTWHPQSLRRAHSMLSPEAQKRWIWWNLAEAPPRSQNFVDIIEDDPAGVEWHSAAETKKLISMMSEVNLRKLEAARASGKRMVGGVYRRTRMSEEGRKVQRAEVRFDDIAGCLRTPAGGSSRQSILLVEGKSVRSRLLSTREAARLMGLPDSYVLPSNYNEAYHLSGDGVAVPAVRHIARNLLEPILARSRAVAQSVEVAES
jgi:DNA (cytosine-5)-methyltransferase 1